MRKYGDNLLAAIAATAALLALSPAARAVPSGYTLNWSDEFNGAVNSQPNSAVWGFDTGAGGWGNNELQTYVTSVANCHVIADGAATDGKALQIEMQTDTSGRFYSARINTGGKKNIGPYGYVEYRAQMPNAGAGYWPACWMMGSNIGTVGWPACGEVDIMEEVNGQNNNHGSLHGPGYDPTAIINGTGFTSAYHTYGALWQQGSISFFVDGTNYETRTSAGAGAGWVFDNKTMFMLINMAMGGNFPGGPNSSTHIPGDLKVDYVRYYVPGSGGGGSLPTGIRTLTPQCATGSRLDLTGGSIANGNKLQIWQSAGNVNQQWNISLINGSSYKLQSAAGNVCLDSAGAAANGTAATVWACNGNANQSWTATSVGSNLFTLTDANAGLCLDVAAAGTANGTVVDTWACNGTNAQKWFVN